MAYVRYKMPVREAREVTAENHMELLHWLWAWEVAAYPKVLKRERITGKVQVPVIVLRSDGRETEVWDGEWIVLAANKGEADRILAVDFARVFERMPEPAGV